MIDRNTAVMQIKRLAGLRGAPEPNNPDSRAAVEELIKALMKTADSDIHAFDIISEVLEKSPFFPVPADIYGQRRERPWTPKLTYQCSVCWDTGWRTVDDGGQGTAVRCSCRPVPSAPQQQGKACARADSIRRGS